jgi:hypothetical protein
MYSTFSRKSYVGVFGFKMQFLQPCIAKYFCDNAALQSVLWQRSFAMRLVATQLCNSFSGHAALKTIRFVATQL